ncbi:MAG TPA: hypothetical protein VIN66_16620 [Rheinheimera sp.]|uniref:hypothetical protein n=1 Tax=Rheinheimera sp. TaxID=1869214 RepID=UPI002F95A17F
MSTLNKKWPAISIWLGSWLVIFWINFAAELSLMMHLFAVPVLLISTAIGAGQMLEGSDPRHGGD